MIRKLSWIWILLCLQFFWNTCSSAGSPEEECRRDSDCASFERCDFLDRRCVCANDQACAQGENCNSSGSCQQKTGCVSNVDCKTDAICDSFSGECIPANGCANDFHCSIGQICLGAACEAGCRDTGDCSLEAREVCVDGKCLKDFCENNHYCGFGQVCDPRTRTCVQPIGPFCTPGCSPICAGCSDKTQGPCRDPANVCFNGGLAGTFCWVACENDSVCPSGYECLPSAVPGNQVCQTDADCAAAANTCGREYPRCSLNQQPCDSDRDCFPFRLTCVLGYCFFGSHCRPPAGCQ